MNRRTHLSTRAYTLFPDSTLYRSVGAADQPIQLAAPRGTTHLRRIGRIFEPEIIVRVDDADRFRQPVHVRDTVPLQRLIAEDVGQRRLTERDLGDRKSTRLNSSH